MFEPRRYVATLTFTVDSTKEDQLQTIRGVANELTSWMESLGGTVHTVNVRRTSATDKDFTDLTRKHGR